MMAQIRFILSINRLRLFRYFVENILNTLIFALTCSTKMKSFDKLWFACFCSLVSGHFVLSTVEEMEQYKRELKLWFKSHKDKKISPTKKHDWSSPQKMRSVQILVVFFCFALLLNMEESELSWKKRTLFKKTFKKQLTVHA